MKARKKLKKSLRRTLKDHFLPHQGNRHTPHVLRHRALFGYSALLVALKVFVVTASIALPSASLFSSAITPTNIISLTNSTRESLELPILSPNDRLAVSAQMKAEDMAANEYFAHTSPAGVTPWSWFGKAGYSYKYAGENLAVYFTEAEDVHAGWLASPTHRANIVDTRYTDIGIGVASGTYKDYPAIFVVQHFGYPSTQNLAATAGETTENVEPETPPAETVEETPVLSATVVPKEERYELEIVVEDATNVTAHLGTESVPLEEKEEDVWTGDVPFNAASLSDSGEQLYVVASGKDEETVETLVLAAPDSETKDVYAFEEPKSTKLFGILNVENIDDGVKQFYIFTMIFLGAMLFLTLLAKFHFDRLPLTGHALTVIALALLLTIF